MKAPFNFIPLATQVFYPYWADQVSHDIPFKESYSGKIDITVTAKSPIFIRNGHGKTEDNSFSHFDIINKDGNKETKYFIPGSSLKGSIRNVLKILSFGKMQIDKNAAYAQRDWYNNQIYPLKSQQNEIKGGWLIEKNGEYKIIECKGIHRIALSRIQEKFGCDRLMDFDRNNNTFNLNSIQTLNDVNYDPKTALYKYKLLENIGVNIITECFDFQNFEQIASSKVKFSTNDENSFKGYIVLTGQNAKTTWKSIEQLDETERDGKSGRNDRDGKFYEFVFEKHSNGESPNEYTIPEEQFRKYDLYIYKDNPDWLEGKKKMRQEPGMPIFFRVKENNNKEIKDFGIAYLYKLPYNKGPYELMSEELGSKFNEDQPDLAEVMFGYSNTKKSLKGRIHFSHLIEKGDCILGNELHIILSSPKPSYYPIYIKQNNPQNGYKTYNDGNIGGWKRYILRDNTIISNESNCSSTLTPINKGSFTGSITFHNLNDIELGALLSTLTFHGNSDCYHQIGQGKPYGMGRIALEISGMTVTVNNEKTVWAEENRKEYMARFEAYMNIYGISWRTSPSIKGLFHMTKNVINKDDSANYDYMTLDTDNNINNFITAKRNSETIPSVSTESITSPISEEDFKGKFDIYTKKYDKIKKLGDDAKQNKEYNIAIRYYLMAEKIYPQKTEDLCSSMVTELYNEATAYYDKQEYSTSLELYKSLQQEIFSNYRSVYEEDIAKHIPLCENKLNMSSQNAIPAKFNEQVQNAKDIKTIKNKLKKWAADLTEEDLEVLRVKLNEISNKYGNPKQKQKEVIAPWKKFLEDKSIPKCINKDILKELKSWGF